MIYFDNEKLFAITAKLYNEVVVEFRVYDTVLIVPDNRPEYISEHGEIVETMEQARPYLHGRVKWDGCVNYSYPAGEDAMLHACGERHFEAEREMWKQVYRMSRELIGEKWYE